MLVVPTPFKILWIVDNLLAVLVTDEVKFWIDYSDGNWLAADLKPYTFWWTPWMLLVIF